MKLIIDIPDEVYKSVKETKIINTTDFDIVSLYWAVKNSEPYNEKWTLTSEMLPEEYDSYLVMWRCLEGDFKGKLFYEICEYDPEEDEWERIEQAGEAGAEIVAWMPLPERYEPKEKENETDSI